MPRHWIPESILGVGVAGIGSAMGHSAARTCSGWERETNPGAIACLAWWNMHPGGGRIILDSLVACDCGVEI